MNNKNNLLLDIALTFTPLSFLAIGGGVSILGDVQREVVNQHQWLTNQEFLNLFAISRVAPGPGTLIVPLIGWHVAGLAGAVIAGLSIFIPTSVLVYGVAYIWHKHPGAIWQRAVATGLAPIAAGLILSSAFSLLHDAKGGWVAWCVAATIVVITLKRRVDALMLLGGGAVLFLALTFVASLV